MSEEEVFKIIFKLASQFDTEDNHLEYTFEQAYMDLTKCK